jgi:sulfotransferase family protein
MIILSAGMPRAGSIWHYKLIHDLMRTTGAADAGEIRAKYRLQNILTEMNCNIGVLHARRLGMVAIPALMGNTFVIKAHAAPTTTSRIFQRLGLLRITYIYRDPRDAMLSAYEIGASDLQRGRPNAFSHLTDFQQSLDFMLHHVHIWEWWVKEKDVLMVRYEDMLREYDGEIMRLLGCLKLDGSRPEIQNVIEAHRPTPERQARINRFREIYSAEQQQLLVEKMGASIVRMGYEVL